VQAAEKPSLYDTTDYFVRKIIAPAGAEVALMLSGDMHHYARYSGAATAGSEPGGRQLITFGGGGAYLSATHELPKRINVPPKETIIRQASARQDYKLAKTYPSRMRSRALSSGVLTRLPARNWGFLVLLGVLQTLLLLALDTADRDILTVPSFVMAATVIGLTMFFAAGLTTGRRTARHYVLGVAHGAVQIGVGVVGLMVWQSLPMHGLRWPLPALVAAVTYGPVAALVATEVVALYLLVAGRLGVNLNELFAGQGIGGYKGFLRLHIGPDGSLTVYAIGIDETCKQWRAAPAAPAHAPWIEPVRPLRPHLIEPPIRIGNAHRP
jgi:hypothetical protein